MYYHQVERSASASPLIIGLLARVFKKLAFLSLRSAFRGHLGNPLLAFKLQKSQDCNHRELSRWLRSDLGLTTQPESKSWHDYL